MAKEKIFSNKIIWDDDDLRDVVRRISGLDSVENLVDELSADQFTDPILGIPVDVTVPTIPPTPDPPPPPTISYPWPISVKSTTVKNDALGNPVIDVVLTFPDVPGADRYEVRLTRL